MPPTASPATPTPPARAPKPASVAAIVWGCRSRCNRCSDFGSCYGDADHDGLAAPLLALVKDDRSDYRGPSGGLEGEAVTAGVKRERTAIKVIGHDFAVHRHLHGGQLIPPGVPHIEHDGRALCAELVHPPRALLGHLAGTGRRHAREKLSPGQPELVLRAELDGSLAGGQALRHGRGGGSGNVNGCQRRQGEGDANQDQERSLHQELNARSTRASSASRRSRRR
jgi:hypothetical protein